MSAQPSPQRTTQKSLRPKNTPPNSGFLLLCLVGGVLTSLPSSALPSPFPNSLQWKASREAARSTAIAALSARRDAVLSAARALVAAPSDSARCCAALAVERRATLAASMAERCRSAAAAQAAASKTALAAVRTDRSDAQNAHWKAAVSAQGTALAHVRDILAAARRLRAETLACERTRALERLVVRLDTARAEWTTKRRAAIGAALQKALSSSGDETAARERWAAARLRQTEAAHQENTARRICELGRGADGQ